MPRFRIERVTAQATLDDPTEELRRVSEYAAAGDDSWSRWLHDYRASRALIVRLRVSILFSAHDGVRDVVEAVNRAVWLEKDVHPPAVEEQLRVTASKDWSAVCQMMRERGFHVSIDELERLYTHVELDAAVRGQLRTGVVEPASRRGDSPRVDVGETPP